MEDLNIRELKGIAERATPGPWTGKIVPVTYPECDDQDLPFVVTRPDGREIVTIPERYWRDDRYDYEHDGQFIATFDPPTVLALLSSAEAREEAWDRISDWTERLQAICEKAGCPAGFNRFDFIANRLAALQAAETRAQQAEARVEELTKALNTVWTLKHVYEAQLDEHDGELDGEDFALVSGIYADIRQALQQGEGK